jgi:hypothetical protein
VRQSWGLLPVSGRRLARRLSGSRCECRKGSKEVEEKFEEGRRAADRRGGASPRRRPLSNSRLNRSRASSSWTAPQRPGCAAWRGSGAVPPGSSYFCRSRPESVGGVRHISLNASGCSSLDGRLQQWQAGAGKGGRRSCFAFIADPGTSTRIPLADSASHSLQRSRPTLETRDCGRCPRAVDDSLVRPMARM